MPEIRTIDVPESELIKALYSGLGIPPAGERGFIPDRTKLLGSTITNGVLELNLSKEFTANYTGDPGEDFVIYCMVNTFTSLDNVDSVQLLIEGQKVEHAIRYIDTSVPLTFNKELLLYY